MFWLLTSYDSICILFFVGNQESFHSQANNEFQSAVVVHEEIMKHLSFAYLFIFLSLLSTGCGPGKLFGPPLTPTPTNTITPSSTSTRTPTSTFTPTNTPTITPSRTPTFAYPAQVGTLFPTPLAVLNSSNFQNFRVLTYLNKGTIQRYAFTPDGGHLVVATTAGIYQYSKDLSELEDFYSFGWISWVKDFSVTEDSKWIVFTDFYNQLNSYEIATRQVVWENSSGWAWEGWGRMVGMSADGRVIVHKCSDTEICILNQNGTEVSRFTPGFFPLGEMFYEHEAKQLLVSRDGKYIAICNSTNVDVHVYQVSDQKEILIGYGVERFGFSYDSQYLWTLNGNFKKVYRLPQGDQPLPVPEVGGAGIVSPDGRFRLRVIENITSVVEIGTEITILNMKFDGRIDSAIFTPDGKSILAVCIGKDDSQWLELRSISDSQVGAVISGFSKGIFNSHNTTIVRDLHFSPDGRWVGACIVGRNLQLWDLIDGNKKVLDTDCDAFAFSPDSQSVAAPLLHGFSIFRISDGEPVLTVPMLDSPHFFSFSSDGKKITNGCDEWYIANGMHSRSCKIGWTSISPDGKILARVDSGQLRIMDSQTGLTTALIRPKDRAAIFNLLVQYPWANLSSINGYEIAYSSTGNFAAIGNEVWNISNGELIAVLDVLSDPELALSPDGRFLAVGGYDGVVKIYGIAR